MKRLATVTPLVLLGLGLAADPQQVTQTAAPPPGQQPVLTFRAGTNVVEADAIVTDASGAFVRNLRKDEFQIFEDGKPVSLNVFAVVDIPIERPDPLLFRPTTIAPDVVSNERPFDGRVFMIVLDAYHVANSRGGAVRRQAQLFVEKYLGENDLASVIHVGNPTLGQEFTSNRRLLLDSIARFNGQALRSATENMIRDARHKASMITDGTVTGRPILDLGPPEDVEAHDRAYQARESANALQRIAQYMMGLSGRRKAVLFFSEGIDYQTMDAPVSISALPAAERVVDEAGSVRVSQASMIAAATRANVSIYAIDPRSIVSEGDDAVGVGILPGQTADIEGARDYQVSRLHGDLGQSIKVAQDSLRYFADETGGLAFVNSNDTDAAFRRVIEDNSSYYLLGYESPDARRDGRFHRVSIQVTRPGVRVRARNGYYAPSATEEWKGGRPDALREMLASPTPLSGLRMRSTAAVVRRSEAEGRVRLTVEFNGQDVALAPRDGRMANDIDVAYEVFDTSSKPRAWGRHILHLKLLEKTAAEFPVHGARYVTEFELPSGRYQLRVAAREQVAGKSGSIFYDVEVPLYGAVELVMSDLLITSTAADKTLTGKGAPPLGWRLPGQTTTARTFDRTETLSIFAGVYDNDPRLHSLDLSVTVTADNGSQVFRKSDTRTSDELSRLPGEFPYTVNIPLQSMEPGRYALVVEARSRLGATARREVEFRIR